MTALAIILIIVGPSLLGAGVVELLYGIAEQKRAEVILGICFLLAGILTLGNFFLVMRPGADKISYRDCFPDKE